MNSLVIEADAGKYTINKNIYGHFSEHLGRCVYEGYWVGEDSSIPNVRGIRQDVVEALRKIEIPVLRWPGGCFADDYHWMDGIGPRGDRPTLINTHWGGVTENNHFGTHEFLDLCEQLGCEPYVCGNVGSGSIREMRDWVVYITFDGTSPMADFRRGNGRNEPWKLKYFGVGNENWGCGGNMRPEFYADVYRRFQTYVRNFSGNRIYKIVCGSYGENYEWTEVLMREAWYLVEPGTNPGFLYQQSTLRDALMAGLNLNIFNAHCERVQMANLAQTINVLQSLILTQDENIVLTPTYHVFDMYKVHQDAVLLPVRLQCRDYVFEEEKISCLNVSASRDDEGKIHLSLCNFDPNKDVKVRCELRGFSPKSLKGQVLTADRINSFNTFKNPDEVKPRKFDAFSQKDGVITVNLPAKSVVVVEITG
ncbi:MAG: alpha-N-arabinofuranosidase [Candidatus Aminicenantes bacterium]|nr:alpha-N-arabinofuranosidase [Candidatus Aminicenantes bacterium]